MPKAPRKHGHEELFAKLVLVRVFPGRYEGGLVIKDKPDLWCVGMKTGVEVVSSEPRESRELIAMYRNWCKKDDPAEKESLASKIEDAGGVLHPFSLEHPPTRAKAPDIMDVVRRKLEKLNSGGYQKFSHQHLFVHCEVPVNRLTLDRMLGDMMSESHRYCSMFERIMLAAPGFTSFGYGCVVYDFDLIGGGVGEVGVPSQVVWDIYSMEHAYYHEEAPEP